VYASLPSLLVLEMLHDVRHVHLVAVDPRFFESAVEDLPGRSHERAPFEVLLVTRLLADQHHLGPTRALAEYRLRSALVELASPTALSGVCQSVEGTVLRKELRRRSLRLGLSHGYLIPTSAQPLLSGSYSVHLTPYGPLDGLGYGLVGWRSCFGR
jgi:hypothetical protein